MHFEKIIITIIIVLLIANLVFNVYSKYKINKIMNKLDSFIANNSFTRSEVEVEDGLIHSVEDDGLPLRSIDMIDRNFDPTKIEMMSPVSSQTIRTTRIEPDEQDSYE